MQKLECTDRILYPLSSFLFYFMKVNVSKIFQGKIAFTWETWKCVRIHFYDGTLYSVLHILYAHFFKVNPNQKLYWLWKLFCLQSSVFVLFPGRVEQSREMGVFMFWNMKMKGNIRQTEHVMESCTWIQSAVAQKSLH